jgi:peptide chain release factor subunit 1
VPLCKDYYFCGKKFYTDELSNVQEKKVGIVKLSISESTISIKEGDYIRVVHKITSGIPSNHHKGGQSQGRYSRKREEAVKEYTKRVAVYIKSMIVDEWLYEGNAEMISMLT